MADILTHLLTEALAAEARAVEPHIDTVQSSDTAARAVTRIRTRRSLLAGGGAVVAAIGVAVVLVVPGWRDDPASPSSPSPTHAGSPSASATVPPAPPTPDASAPASPAEWESVAEDDKPDWAVAKDAAEPRARAMEDWVWDYVDSDWRLWVFTALGADAEHPSSQALFLEAPNGDQLRLFDLAPDYKMSVEHWDPDHRAAWIAQCPGGDSCATLQIDLATGTTTGDWGGSAIPSRARSDWGPDGVTNVGMVAALPTGDELWALYTYYGTYDGFLLRGADGTFRDAPGADQIDSGIDSGTINGVGDPGIEAWLTDDYHYAIVLVQTALAHQSDPGVIHTASGTWIVIDFWNGTATATQPFEPVPPACSAAPGLVPAGDGAIPASVTATCGGVTYALVPLTAEANAVPN